MDKSNHKQLFFLSGLYSTAVTSTKRCMLCPYGYSNLEPGSTSCPGQYFSSSKSTFFIWSSNHIEKNFTN